MIKKILETITESSRKSGAGKRTQIPVLPLDSVLLPGGSLALKIFEERYMNMVKAALKSGEPFGIVLIKRGQEVGEPATPESVGTIAEIQTWDMRQLGVLDIGVVGGSRFRIAASRIGAHGLILADVENIADDVSAASQNLSVCATFPARIFAAGRNDIHGGRLLFDNAFWVGMRLAEMLPLVSTTKQKMLELTDATMRLELLAKYLIDQGLVSREKRYLPNPLVAN